MNPPERGFLLLTSQLGNPERKPLTVAQLRELTARVRASDCGRLDKTMDETDLTALGYGPAMARRILSLLEDEELLDNYLQRGRRSGCVPITRAASAYPLRVRKRLGVDSPGCLWAMGNMQLLNTRCVSLVGSRDLRPENRNFAQKVGIQAANQGYTLVSGNARGADITAQEACLKAGGNVICVVADRLDSHRENARILYLSEDGFDSEFSAQRALSRNRVIHSLSCVTLVAQCSLGTGGTWNGTVRNLRGNWSGVWCFADTSASVEELCRMGARRIGCDGLSDFSVLENESANLFDRA